MFCPKCGKTIPFDAAACSYCGLPVGESRFEGSPYTSAQAHIQPGDNVRELFARTFVRSAYTAPVRETPVFDDSVQEAPAPAAEVPEPQDDEDGRTGYRPTYDKSGVSGTEHVSAADAESNHPSADFSAWQPPQDAESNIDFETFAAQNDAAAAEEAAPAEAEEADEFSLGAIDMNLFRARPIESAGQIGISADITERMQKFEANPPRRVRGFGRRAVYDDFEPQEDIVEVQPEAAEEDVDTIIPPEEVDDEQPEVFDEIDDEEFEEIRHSEFGVRQVLKIIIAVVIVAALIVGGVLWMNYIRANQSSTPIENVRDTLYTDGVALIESHASTENVEQVILNYSAGGDLSSLQSQLSAFSAAVTALSPEDPTENEQIFLQAIQKIENNITNCIISDVIAVGSNDADSAAKSDERWRVVNNSIALLKVATSTAELTAIINGEEIDIQQRQAEVTPTPEPAVNYNTLSRGDKSDEVVEMQTRLYALGYLTEAPDGQFGGKTQTAVKIFQQMCGLPVTGIADNVTLTALYSDEAPAANLAN